MLPTARGLTVARVTDPLPARVQPLSQPACRHSTATIYRPSSRVLGELLRTIDRCWRICRKSMPVLDRLDQGLMNRPLTVLNRAANRMSVSLSTVLGGLEARWFATA